MSRSALRHSLVLAVIALLVAAAASAQEFQIQRAMYGIGDRWVDVTPQVRELARVTRAFRVANDTFGVDPAPGRGKILRVEVRGARGDVRLLDYAEGTVVAATHYAAWGGNAGRGVLGGGGGGGEVGDIVRAEYGDNARWVDVTPRVRELARGDRTFRVSNELFGIDPAVGRQKTLRIDVRGPRGDIRTFTYPEGGFVDGSQFGAGGGFGRADGLQGSPQSAFYQLARAEYGAGDRWVDVTARVRDLAREERFFTVTNETFGIDPAPGRTKALRIEVRGPRGDLRIFEYQERSGVNRPHFADWRDGRSTFVHQLVILSAVYGAFNRGVDVTSRVRSQVREGRLNLTVDNFSMDVDPAPGARKTLTVTYAISGGVPRQVVVGEGDPLVLP